MMFLEPDEHIIILEDVITKVIDEQDMLMLKDAGMKTLLITHRESVGFDVYRHFKVLLPFFYTNKFYSEPRSFVDLVNDKERILTLAKGVLSNPPRVQHAFAIPDGGEFFFDALQTDNYPLSDDQIIDFVISVQKILVRQHNEIWMFTHNFLGDPDNWNNTHLPVLYQALCDEFPSSPIYSVQFAHFTCGNIPTNEKLQWKLKKYTEEYGIKFFVGSDYCEGLDRNFDRAIEQKAYGYVTSPLHSFNPNKHDKIENWMVQKLRETNRKFNEHYNSL